MKIATYYNIRYLNIKQKPICQNEKWRTEYRMIHSICFQRAFVCRESRQQDRLELLLPCVSFRRLSSLDQCYNATRYVGTLCKLRIISGLKYYLERQEIKRNPHTHYLA